MTVKYRWLLPILIAAIILWIIFKAFRATEDTRRECLKEKEMSFKGIVKSIEPDNVNRAQKTIFLINGLRIDQTFTIGLWNEAKVGDSIVKDKGTLNYVIYQGPDFETKRILKWDKPCR